MIHDFIYDIPVRVYFGRDQLSNLGTELKQYGTRVLMTYGGGSIKRMGLYDRVVKEIKDAGLELFELSGIEPNPRIDSVRRASYRRSAGSGRRLDDRRHEVHGCRSMR